MRARRQPGCAPRRGEGVGDGRGGGARRDARGRCADRRAKRRALPRRGTAAARGGADWRGWQGRRRRRRWRPARRGWRGRSRRAGGSAARGARRRRTCGRRALRGRRGDPHRARGVPRAREAATCQRRARRRRVAAASAEPPPMPLATGRDFTRRSVAPRPGGCRRSAARRTRLSEPALRSRAKGPSSVSERVAAGSASTTSPSRGKTTMLSSRCNPSGRRPVTCSARLTLAGANSASGAATDGLSRPVAGRRRAPCRARRRASFGCGPCRGHRRDRS